jgi:hypothetical protein
MTASLMAPFIVIIRCTLLVLFFGA